MSKGFLLFFSSYVGFRGLLSDLGKKMREVSLIQVYFALSKEIFDYVTIEKR